MAAIPTPKGYTAMYSGDGGMRQTFTLLSFSLRCRVLALIADCGRYLSSIQAHPKKMIAFV